MNPAFCIEAKTSDGMSGMLRHDASPTHVRLLCKAASAAYLHHLERALAFHQRTVLAE